MLLLIIFLMKCKTVAEAMIVKCNRGVQCCRNQVNNGLDTIARSVQKCIYRIPLKFRIPLIITKLPFMTDIFSCP